MDVSIIIVSYNTALLLRECLNSLRAANNMEKEIFVVDNFSTDNSAAMVAENFPEVKLIINKENRGFGAANNQALAQCRGRYVVFLNPDTTVNPATLQNAVAFMDANQHIGLAGAKILNPDGTTQESVSYRYPGEKFTAGEAAALPGEIACVLGAFMIAPKRLIDELRGFDEDFFLYGEDQDLAWRIRESGFAIGYIANAEVLHWGGQSEVGTPPVARFEKKLKAEYLFYAKHYKPETIARIKRTQRRKAVFRLATLKIFLPFSRRKKVMQNKFDCYRLVYKMACS
ncbi:MAG TPA: glycosyltransferase family 2 protein [Smithellaceae bacterium]|nr:glycosyltransferase family 2 protein [Smithellaceae bacterium]